MTEKHKLRLCPVCNMIVVSGKHETGGSKCLEELGIEAQRVALSLLPFWKAIALRHNGFNPETGLDEPTPKQAVDELMAEAVELHASEIEIRICDILNTFADDGPGIERALRALAKEERWIV